MNNSSSTASRGTPSGVLTRLLMLACCALLLPLQALAGTRLALVIGNSGYADRPLRNPGNDAADVAAALKDLGFELYERKPQLNLNRRSFNAALGGFVRQASGADLVVVYYSGHGLQASGDNYLVPTDARIDEERDIRTEGIRLADLLNDLEDAKVQRTVVILDACRDNPFNSRAKSLKKGLARIEPQGATLIAFATAEGLTADDGTGRHGVYTEALLQNLRDRRLDVRDVLDETALAVGRASKGQRPRVYGDTALFKGVYLGGAGMQVAALEARPRPAGPSGGTANFGDLEQAQKDETAARKKWDAWLAQMKADYQKALAFGDKPELAGKALERFLAAYAEDDPYSTEDDKWRQDASARLDTINRSRRAVAAPAPARQSVARVDYVWPASASEIAGAGASFPSPLYAKWAEGYASATGSRVNYLTVGSSAGIKQIKARTVDFGATDMPLSKAELDQEDLIQFPTVLGGVAVVVNLSGIGPASLKLTGGVLADIYLGKITHWSDPAIAALNPHLSLPDAAITVVRRADGSGTTLLLTNYLSKVSDDWRARVGEGATVNWPVGAGAKGNEGVAAYLTRLPNSIAYVEMAYAEQNRLSTVLLKNADGNFVGPSLNAVQAAASGFDWSDASQRPILTNQHGAGSWPIVGASFLLVPRVAEDDSRTVAVLKFFDWAFRNGQQAADQLQYVRLPTSVVHAIEASWGDLRQRSGRALLARAN